MKTTNVFAKNLNAYEQGFRRIANVGGTWSTKTHSILQLLFLIAQSRRKSGVLISVLSETLPHLKLGAIRDFESILKREDRFNENDIDYTNHAYHFGNAVVEFYAGDLAKVTGIRRDIVFFNEVNHIPYAVVEAAEQRTKETIFYDFNPTSKFWFEDKVLSLSSDEVKLIKSNYKDGLNVIPDTIVKDIELKASRDPNFKRVHIDIEYGVYEGLVFPDFTLVDAMPEGQGVYGMDFGFSADPTTLIDCRYSNGELWFDELLYQTQMTNNDIVKFLKEAGIGKKEIIADSAEPKSIREISLAGFNIAGADKGADSVRAGIDKIKSYKINITKRSLNLVKELRSYKWKSDKNGNSTNQPLDLYNHCIDAMRYGTMRLRSGSLKPPKVTF